MTPTGIRWAVRAVFLVAVAALVTAFAMGPPSDMWNWYDAGDLAVTLTVWAAVELAVWRRDR